MANDKLDALVKIGTLHAEPSEAEEVESLVASGKVRLIDAKNSDLSIESRFDLAYNTSHSLALAALRKNGYRSSKRYLVSSASNILWASLQSVGAYWTARTRKETMPNTKECLMSVRSLLFR